MQVYLSTRHGQVDLQKQLRIKQGTVLVAHRNIDPVALAQCIKTVMRIGMQFARQCERIQYPAAGFGNKGTATQAF